MKGIDYVVTTGLNGADALHLLLMMPLLMLMRLQIRLRLHQVV